MLEQVARIVIFRFDVKFRQMLVVGSTVLGTAVGCFLLWPSTLTRELPVGPAAPGAVGSPASLGAHAPPQARVNMRENGVHGTFPAASPPTPSQSQPELEALLQQADSAEGETARRDSAARIAETMDEAWHQFVEDPNAALAWALDQDHDMARVALQVVLGEWAQDDPAAAFDAMTLIADGSADSNLHAYGTALVVESWAAVDPAAAWGAVEILPSSPGTAFLRSRILTAWAENDPADAAASLQALVNETANAGPEPQGMHSAVLNVAYRLARDYGAEAARWAVSFPKGTEARTSALAGVVSGWVDDNPEAVGDWLQAMDAGPERDAGVVSMVRLYAAEAPATALAWAETISDEAQRSSLLATTAGRWLSAAPEDAEAWMRTATVLTDEQREGLFEARRTIPEPGVARKSP